MASQHDEKNSFNQAVLNDSYQLRATMPYTWVLRWVNKREFSLKLNEDTLTSARSVIGIDKSEIHRYFKQVIEIRPYSIVYHRSGESKLKHCSDMDHFHAVTCHPQHPTSENSFIVLWKLLSERASHPYTVTAPKVYNPYGLCTYFEKEPDKRAIVAAGNLRTEPQNLMYKQLTKKKTLLEDKEESSEDDADTNSKKNIVRGKNMIL